MEKIDTDYDEDFDKFRPNFSRCTFVHFNISRTLVPRDPSSKEENDPENEVVSILVCARVAQDINRTIQSSYTKLLLYFCLNGSVSDI